MAFVLRNARVPIVTADVKGYENPKSENYYKKLPTKVNSLIQANFRVEQLVNESDIIGAPKIVFLISDSNTEGFYQTKLSEQVPIVV